MLGLSKNEELEQMGQILVKQLKNRYNDPGVHNKFVLGVDRSKMRLFDVEQSSQPELVDTNPAPDISSSPKFEKKKSFADFSF